MSLLALENTEVCPKRHENATFASLAGETACVRMFSLLKRLCRGTVPIQIAQLQHYDCGKQRGQCSPAAAQTKPGFYSNLVVSNSKDKISSN